ncbi:MAG: hypothetical protein JXB34_13440 [Bacteroidales bacterium]|nr:hypothetical protein [Bacteroidales bacterium]
MEFLEKLRRLDNFWFGLITGLALPLALYPLIRPLDPATFNFIKSVYKLTIIKLLPMLLSRCIFPNALLFFIFIWSGYERAAKGILYSTVAMVSALILIQIIF